MSAQRCSSNCFGSWPRIFYGGGSALMWANGRVVNFPADGKHRDIASALIVMKKSSAGASTARQAPKQNL